MGDLMTSSNAFNALSSQMTSRANEAKAASENGKVEKAGRDFEALLLTNWLQQAEQTMTKVPGTDEEEASDDCGKEQYMSLAMESLGASMAANGGIGIAKLITTQLHRADQKEGGRQEP